jgi:HD-GYP domain-containing protein (c-di-GMP phosphodiesterase class II)
MRFVPVNCIRDGMIAAKRILGKNGELYLNQGCRVHHSYIEKIAELGYMGIYVDDDQSKDIEIVEFITDDLRHKTVKALKNVFINIEDGKELKDKDIRGIGRYIEQIVNDISDSKEAMINMIDLKAFDDYTFFHSVNVTILSMIIGVALNLNKTQLCQLGLSAILHDIGKVFIPKEIINKPGTLNMDEFEAIKSHSQKGYEYLKEKFDLPIVTALGVLQHHEKYDGTGYPSQTAADKISLFGRIIAVADVYDALTSSRPYRKALSPSESIEYIMGNGSKHFDPDLAKVFTKRVAPYPTGTCVRLSNDYSGIVAENYSDCSIRPKVKIIRHAEEDVDPYYVNLRSDSQYLNVTIVGFEDIA